MYEQIPAELKQLPNWVCWSLIADEVKGKPRKVPINPLTGGAAQSNNPQTWCTFEKAVEASAKYKYSGVGFMFSGCDYFGVDIDNVRDCIQDYQNGSKGNIISEFVNALKCYTELSQSGNGIHIICRGKLPPNGRRRGNVEMYESGRFFVMTGNKHADYNEILDCTETIKPLHEKYIGGGTEPNVKVNPPARKYSAPSGINEIIELASAAKNGNLFKTLYSGNINGYPSQSEADMAFCSMLAFWCGRDAEKMDCIFRSSGLMREKWDRAQSGSTYGLLTIQKAIAQCENVYEPPAPQNDNYSITIGNEPDDSAPVVKLYTFDDMGNAQRFVDLFGDRIRYCYTDKSWMYYDSRKWCWDDSGAAERAADKSIDAMSAEAKFYIEKESETGDMEKQFNKHIKQSRSNKAKKAMLSESMHHVPISHIQMDRNKFLLNTPNGILDLKNGKIIEHTPKLFITKITNVEYTDNADCPLWKSFLNDIFNGDKDLIRYIQKAAGYTLTGSTAEQCAFFLYGTGRNGKSTFLDVLRDVLGEYAVNIQPETIMVRGNNNSANSDIARLKSARFVTSVEPNEGVRLNEGLLKQLTGDDPVTARKLYSSEFEFKPEFKLWMATNHKPIIRGTDTGIWRRIHMIPFTVQIPENKVDRNLKAKLTGEFAAILHWAVEGCLMYCREGLRMPNAVFNAVNEYRREMDVITAFIEAQCVVGAKYSVQASVLYAAYCAWCDAGNEYKMSNTKFGTEISKRFEKLRNNNSIVYKGLNLI